MPEPAEVARGEVVTADGEAVEPADRLDPRAFLVAPFDSPQAVLDWALEHAPAYVCDDETALRRAAERADLDAWHQLGEDAQLRARREWRARYPDPYRGLPPRDCWRAT